MSDSANEDAGEESPLQYAIRISRRASRELNEAVLRMEEITGDENIAREWYLGLRTAIGSLATQPGRYPILPGESRHAGQEMRRILYRRTMSSGSAYYVYYSIENDEDGPLIMILHLRHASRKPLSAREARTLREET